MCYPQLVRALPIIVVLWLVGCTTEPEATTPKGSEDRVCCVQQPGTNDDYFQMCMRAAGPDFEGRIDPFACQDPSVVTDCDGHIDADCDGEWDCGDRFTPGCVDDDCDGLCDCSPGTCSDPLECINGGCVSGTCGGEGSDNCGDCTSYVGCGWCDLDFTCAQGNRNAAFEGSCVEPDAAVLLWYLDRDCS